MANRTFVQARGPKRRIEKVYSQVVNTVTNTTTSVTLHTAEDSKTLVRLIVKGMWTPIDGGAVGYTIAREPNGTAVIAPSAGSSLDNDMNSLEIIRGVAGWGASSTESMPVDIDSKGMRKLQVGDEITFRHVGDTATMGTFSGVFIMVFKE